MNNAEILNDLKTSLINDLNEKIVDVILFGSQAKKNTKGDSDFDILFIVNCKIDWKLERQISDLCCDVELKFDIHIDAHVLAKEELTQPRGNQLIYQYAIINGIYA
jgi:predicted nucleotidyltransferase